jgi:hypothetical protein
LKLLRQRNPPCGVVPYRTVFRRGASPGMRLTPKPFSL